MKRKSLTVLAAVIIGVGVLIYWFTNKKVDAFALQPEDRTLVVAGKLIYQQNCAACHGANLEGQPNWRTRLPNGRLPAPPHDKTGHTWHHTDELLFKITKLGNAAIVGNGYESDMMGFKDQLSDKEIVAVLSYIKSTWPEEIRTRHDRMNKQSQKN